MNRRTILFRTLLLAILGMAASCQTAPQAEDDGRLHAQCLVCKCNADLACVDVVVDEQTPTAQYESRTYYFCSDECRDDFVKKPGKYSAHASK